MRVAEGVGMKQKQPSLKDQFLCGMIGVALGMIVALVIISFL